MLLQRQHFNNINNPLTICLKLFQSLNAKYITKSFLFLHRFFLLVLHKLKLLDIVSIWYKDIDAEYQSMNIDILYGHFTIVIVLFLLYFIIMTILFWTYMRPFFG